MKNLNENRREWPSSETMLGMLLFFRDGCTDGSPGFPTISSATSERSNDDHLCQKLRIRGFLIVRSQCLRGKRIHVPAMRSLSGLNAAPSLVASLLQLGAFITNPLSRRLLDTTNTITRTAMVSELAARTLYPAALAGETFILCLGEPTPCAVSSGVTAGITFI